jgi:hypothetical protein
VKYSSLICCFISNKDKKALSELPLDEGMLGQRIFIGCEGDHTQQVPARVVRGFQLESFANVGLRLEKEL